MQTSRTKLLFCAVFVLGGAIAAQQVAPVQVVPKPQDDNVGRSIDAPSVSFHRERRQELMRRIGSGVIVVRSAAAIESYERFHQSHNFLYLTGIEEADAALILIPQTQEEILVVPPPNRFKEQWDGPMLRPGEKGQEQTGIAAVVPGSARTLVQRLQEALERCGDDKSLWCEHAPEERGAMSRDNLERYQEQWRRDPLDGRQDRNQHLVAALTKLVPEATIRDASPHLDAMRTIKQAEELRVLRYAAELACKGIAEAMKAVRPGQREYELAAVADYCFKRHGAQGIGYMPIVGSGPNGCVLHHWRNDRRMSTGELVVMDFAPSVHGYVADVTRTFPVGGKFSQAQRKLVQDVYDAQQAIFAELRPGVSLTKLSGIASKLLVERGYKPGVNILHGPCHHLGMAVHDVSQDGSILRPGMYITVEPGAYLVDEGMGCRIEDCVLVTEDGYELLSKGCPSTPDEIEALMQKHGLAEAPRGER